MEYESNKIIEWIKQNKEGIFVFAVVFFMLVGFLCWQFSWYPWIIIPFAISAVIFIFVGLNPIIFGLDPLIFMNKIYGTTEDKYPRGKRLRDAGFLCSFIMVVFTLGTSAEFNQISKRGHLDDRFKDGVGLLDKEKFYNTISGIFILKEVANEADRRGNEEKIYIERVRTTLCFFMREYSSDFEEKNKKNDENEKYKRKTIFQDIVDVLSKPVFKKDNSKLELSSCDLSELKLGNLKLIDANLKNATLTGADLTGADLTGADLTGADLSYNALLTGANFSHATLNDANFFCADVSGVNFTKADLSYTDFTQTNIKGTIFKDAIMYYVELGSINLGNVNEKTNFKGALLDYARISSRILGAKSIKTTQKTIIVNQ